jgi:hypothetical protein
MLRTVPGKGQEIEGYWIPGGVSLLPLRPQVFPTISWVIMRMLMVILFTDHGRRATLGSIPESFTLP